jgi:hypothetical protein
MVWAYELSSKPDSQGERSKEPLFINGSNPLKPKHRLVCHDINYTLFKQGDVSDAGGGFEGLQSFGN